MTNAHPDPAEASEPSPPAFRTFTVKDFFGGPEEAERQHRLARLRPPTREELAGLTFLDLPTVGSFEQGGALSEGGVQWPEGHHKEEQEALARDWVGWQQQP